MDFNRFACMLMKRYEMLKSDWNDTDICIEDMLAEIEREYEAIENIAGALLCVKDIEPAWAMLNKHRNKVANLESVVEVGGSL